MRRNTACRCWREAVDAGNIEGVKLPDTLGGVVSGLEALRG